MNNKAIFPNIEVIIIKGQPTWAAPMMHQVQFKTWVRKKYRGKWYLWYVKRVHDFPLEEFDTWKVLEIQNIFLYDVYLSLLFGKINPKLTADRNGVQAHLFELDADQRSEEERLLPPINPKRGQAVLTPEDCLYIKRKTGRLP